MLFALEALKARHGDALLLHYGRPDRPRLIVIDGGPSGVYRAALRPRLEELRALRSPDAPLPIRLLMVSHIDDDHIRGVLDLTADMVEREDLGQPAEWRIRSLWHNSFDDIVGNGAGELFAAARAEVGAAAFGDTVPDGLAVPRDTALVLANVPQGRTLRNAANRLGLELNGADGGLILAPADPQQTFDAGDGLRFRVLAPNLELVAALQKEWDKQLEKKGLAQSPQPADGADAANAADFLDKSVFNLSSIVVLAEAAGRRMLLTGDARGDHLLAAVERAGLFDAGGRLHVDVLKLPHHGSHHNVDLDFFRRITADHYVASGDGKYGNPELETIRLLAEARGDDPYVLHLTYRPEELKPERPGDELLALFEEHRQAGKRYEVRLRDADAVSLVLDLGDDPYEGQ